MNEVLRAFTEKDFQRPLESACQVRFVEGRNTLRLWRGSP